MAAPIHPGGNETEHSRKAYLQRSYIGSKYILYKFYHLYCPKLTRDTYNIYTRYTK